MTRDRGTPYAAAGLAVLLVGWIAWGRRVHGVGVPLLTTLLASGVLFGLAVRATPRVHGAAVALVASLAYLGAAVDPATGYDERNAYCFLAGTVFVVVAAVRGYPTERRLEASGGGRALAAVTWTTTMLLVAAVVTFIAVTTLALWLAGR